MRFWKTAAVLPVVSGRQHFPQRPGMFSPRYSLEKMRIKSSCVGNERRRARAIVARQRDDELGKNAGLGFDIDPAAMLLDDDVVSHGEAEPRSFPGRLGGEEGIEHLLPHLGRNAGAVVADAD